MKMKTFKGKKLKDYNIVCEHKNTRRGFKHEATLLFNGYEIAFAKCCYLNRTWEAYEFETAMLDVINKSSVKESLKLLMREDIKNSTEV